MSNQQRILLVEGQGDRNFLQAFLCHLDLAIDVEPKTPKDFCSTESDGVDVVRTQALPFAYQRIKRGEITHLQQSPLSSSNTEESSNKIKIFIFCN